MTSNTLKVNESIRLPLWPGVDEESLRKTFRSIGPRAFERGYRQRPYSEEEKIFPSFLDCIQYGASWRNYYLMTPKKGWRFGVGCDLSRDNRAGNVIFVLAVDSENYRYPVDIRMGRWTSPQMADQIKTVNAEYHPDCVMVENNGYQQALIDWMQQSEESVELPLMAYTTTGKKKRDAAVGLPGLEIEFYNKLWRICIPEKHGFGCECAWCRWLHEMQNYPGSTDDTVMACFFAREAIKFICREYYRVVEAEDEDEDEF